ncbi:hypothetical protein B0H16DRAFT_1778505 [Mycena metata]|uniref:Uncharacterized protein n=1 Tax=Mycena metata TaxID=1033252 RepID=A0AAD7HSV8_9AGAR|nr:hypothetical protein B0H16DRAFT_1778505 [Mycena metata]
MDANDRITRLFGWFACLPPSSTEFTTHAFVAENADGTPKYSGLIERRILRALIFSASVASIPGWPTLLTGNSPLKTVCLPVAKLWTGVAAVFGLIETTASHAPASFPATSDSAETHRHAPTTAFTGLPRPVSLPRTTSVQNTRTLTVRDTVQSQRRVSIQRTLHPNAPGGSSSASSNSVVTTPTKRKSGPPRPYSRTTATLSSLDDFSLAAVVNSAPLTVVILPKVLETSDYIDMLDLSPRYTWKGGADMEIAQLTLKRANLVFVVDVDLNGPIFETINEGFVTHCRTHNIHYVAPPRPVENTPNTMAWVLLGPKGRTGNRVWVEDPKGLTRFTFTLSNISALPFSYTSNHLGEGPLILIAPKLRNLYGPIDPLFDPVNRLPEHVLAHRCFGRRICHTILASLGHDPKPVCGPLCAPSLDPVPRSTTRRPAPDIQVMSDSDNDDELDMAEASPRPASTIVTRSVRRQQWQEEAAMLASPVVPAPTIASVIAAPQPVPAPVLVAPTIMPFIPGPLLATAMELTSISVKPRSFSGPDGPLDLTLQSPGSGANSFAAWQDHMLIPHETGDYVSINARSVDEGALALITLSFWLFAGRPTGGLKLKEVLQEQFASPRPTVMGFTSSMGALFGLRVSIALGFGKGPRNEVVAEAVKILLVDGRFWTQRENYKALRLHPSRSGVPARACVLKATGLILLLHVLFIGAPVVISPFLFSTLFDGRNAAAKFDPEFLSRFISHGSLSLIKRLQRVAIDMPLYTSASEDCVEYQVLLNVPDVDHGHQLCHTRDCRHRAPSRLPVHSDGFNVVVDPFDGQEHPHHILEWFATPARELILAAFDRQIKTPADVVSHLEFTQTNPEDDPWMENQEIVALVTRFVTHYLMGVGHPVDPHQVIHALIDDNGTVDNSVLRATLFLSVVTGASILPVSPTWTVKCLITHDWSQDYPTTDAAGRDDYGPEVLVSFRSCFKTFAITNDARLRHLLLSETPVDGRDTELGRFIHAALLASRAGYTAA